MTISEILRYAREDMGITVDVFTFDDGQTFSFKLDRRVRRVTLHWGDAHYVELMNAITYVITTPLVDRKDS